MFHIVLVEPEIPQNTGNIARTCACTGTALHLVRPMAFEITDASVKRAGLDYWDKVKIFYYDSLAEFLKRHESDELYFLSTKAKKRYTDIKYPDNAYFLFGKETKGLPEDLIYGNPDRSLTIPMNQTVRSLNLANSAAIVLYEALRQKDFPL